MAKIRIDGTRTQTIRTVLLAAFAAVAVVLLVALGLHKLKGRGLHMDLPGQLGADISQTANGFTYSQSQRGHTIFTIHASKIVQYKGNEAELRDVNITLYGPEGSHRQDRILGSDFLYNKSTGQVMAKGQVEIDMASPTAGGVPGKPGTATPDAIHVQTSGLRFDQRSGEAHTDEALSFTLPRANGKAVGGDYNSRTGVLTLGSAVEFRADGNGSPAVVYAEHAQLLRDAHVAYLLRARSEYEGGHSSADQAIVHFRPDGSIQHLDVENHVHMLTADGAELYSTTATVDLDDRSQPLSANAGGGVNFLSGTPELNLHGNAVEGTMVFKPGVDGKAVLNHAQFRNAVSFVVQQKSLGGDPRGSANREMTASRLDVEFAPGPGGKSLAQKATAAGGATVDMHDLPYGGQPKHTTIYGQQLIANLVNGHELRQLDGSGGTKVVDYASDGATDTSTGDTLHATFLPISRAHEPPRKAVQGVPGSESAEVDAAVQQGHVSLVAEPARDARRTDGAPQGPLFAEAGMLTYHASDQQLHLTGDAIHPPRVHNDTLALTATEVDYRRNSGDAIAHGDVRSTYGSKPADGKRSGAPGLGGAGPVHIVAALAEMMHSTNAGVFRGDMQTPARMWQGANSVTAPVLELGKQAGSLDAHGENGAHGTVHAVFSGRTKDATTSKTGQPANMLTRVTADTLFYSDTTRTADFRGGVVAQQPNGTVDADDAQVFLTEAPQGQSSQLDRMIATGHVALTQTGRRGTGEKLVYTAADANYLLTGTPGEPPRALDTQRGATSGAALLFRSGDGSVEVQSNDAEGNSRRTVTDTRAPK
jgi:lipopolysaccharide export system protein LptA